MTKSEKLTKAILSSMGKEGDPIGILIETVLEKEFKSYDDLLKECKNALFEDRMSIKDEIELVDRIDTQLNEDKSKLRGPMSS